MSDWGEQVSGATNLTGELGQVDWGERFCRSNICNQAVPSGTNA